ncbi:MULTISPECIES: anthranilate synthase family protein [Streptomyces]|uniref:anthranilate synthase family protein n=1 Tax=Streptomyces TaxID=1883 RepID=UPI0011694B06|nr:MULTISPECIES: anthranilate synthase family protein [unclassified Streptomyces]TQL19583.1 phenazine biosynthesis protein phzE [Streptomyces sp. SLBN-134]
MTAGAGSLLRRIADGTHSGPFALLHRPESGAPDRIDVLAGPVDEYETLAGLPLDEPGGDDGFELLALVPHRQIGERGFDHVDDGTPLAGLRITAQESVPLDEVLAALPRSADHPLALRDGGFELDDRRYADTVRRVLDEEIASGAGANFVLRRDYSARLAGWSVPAALAYYGRLLRRTSGQHWTFLVHLGDRTLVGASPERHVSLDEGRAVMNPISGTYRYPEEGPEAEGLLEFLADDKETNELFMVVDEELKMMSAVCADGGRVLGPRLRMMAHIAHTEYFIEGRTALDPREILRRTLLAPTVTGSPLESACSVIARFEPEGRGYYSGVAALVGRRAGERTMDSAILIRTMDIDRAGALRLGVGATLVRDSDPMAEAAETRAKAAGLLAAVAGAADEDVSPPAATAGHGDRLARLPSVREALVRRNEPLAPFWLTDPGARSTPRPALAGRRVLIIDAEDHFTAMGATLLRALGCEVEVRRYDEDYALQGPDLVVVGPGPGDPRDRGHAKIDILYEVTGQLLEQDTPFLSVCLGHQVLSRTLGLDLVRRPVPNQGVQRAVDLFGSRELVYFYNSFTAVSGTDEIPSAPVRPGTVRIARDALGDEVLALRGPGFCSVQFHPASVMTRNGDRVLGDLLTGLLAPPVCPPPDQGVPA